MPPELQFLVVVGSALAGWVAWVKAVAPAFRWASGMKDRMDDTYGEAGRPGVPARPGMMQRLAMHDEQLQALSLIKDAIPELRDALQEIQVRDAERAEAIRDIQYHVQPNSGHSAHDALSKQLHGLAQAQVAVVGSVDKLRDDMTADLRELREDKRRAHDDIRARLARIETRAQTPGGEES